MQKKKNNRTIKVTKLYSTQPWYVIKCKRLCTIPQENGLKGRINRFWHRLLGKKKQGKLLPYVMPSDAKIKVVQRHARSISNYTDLWN